jgi:ABC-2 type transport system permease protein
MAVYRRGYHRYQGLIMGHWVRFMVLPRFAWRRLFQLRLVVMLTVVAMIWPLLCACFIYLTNHADLLKGIGSEFRKFITVNGDFFLVFMKVQAAFAVFLAALTGPGLIAPDLANNALPLYFSRPLTRLDYILARLLVLCGMLSLITLVPGLILFGMQVGMAGWGWMQAHWTLGTGMVAGFIIWVLLVSIVALASSSWVKWQVVAGALVLAFFSILGGVALMINTVFRVTWGHALNPGWAVNQLWCELLGVEQNAGPGTPACAMVLAAIMVLLAILIGRKLRPVEVIS